MKIVSDYSVAVVSTKPNLKHECDLSYSGEVLFKYNIRLSKISWSTIFM
jgi:hypothetical protein